jgi:hypothetical protein
MELEMALKDLRDPGMPGGQTLVFYEILSDGIYPNSILELKKVRNNFRIYN